MADTLTITDNRTGKQYEIPVHDGTVKATDLRQIKVTADEFAGFDSAHEGGDGIATHVELDAARAYARWARG